MVRMRQSSNPLGVRLHTFTNALHRNLSHFRIKCAQRRAAEHPISVGNVGARDLAVRRRWLGEAPWDQVGGEAMGVLLAPAGLRDADA